jgi:hypothetical protein
MIADMVLQQLDVIVERPLLKHIHLLWTDLQCLSLCDVPAAAGVDRGGNIARPSRKPLTPARLQLTR